jgi:hypothetical protein
MQYQHIPTPKEIAPIVQNRPTVQQKTIASFIPTVLKTPPQVSAPQPVDGVGVFGLRPQYSNVFYVNGTGDNLSYGSCKQAISKEAFLASMKTNDERQYNYYIQGAIYCSTFKRGN